MLLSSALKKKQYCFATFFFFFAQALPTAVGFWFLKQENYNYIRTEIIALLKLFCAEEAPMSNKKSP